MSTSYNNTITIRYNSRVLARYGNCEEEFVVAGPPPQAIDDEYLHQLSPYPTVQPQWKNLNIILGCEEELSRGVVTYDYEDDGLIFRIQKWVNYSDPVDRDEEVISRGIVKYDYEDKGLLPYPAWPLIVNQIFDHEEELSRSAATFDDEDKGLLPYPAWPLIVNQIFDHDEETERYPVLSEEDGFAQAVRQLNNLVFISSDDEVYNTIAVAATLEDDAAVQPLSWLITKPIAPTSYDDELSRGSVTFDYEDIVFIGKPWQSASVVAISDDEIYNTIAVAATLEDEPAIATKSTNAWLNVYAVNRSEEELSRSAATFDHEDDGLILRIQSWANVNLVIRDEEVEYYPVLDEEAWSFYTVKTPSSIPPVLFADDDVYKVIVAGLEDEPAQVILLPKWTSPLIVITDDEAIGRFSLEDETIGLVPVKVGWQNLPLLTPEDEILETIYVLDEETGGLLTTAYRQVYQQAALVRQISDEEVLGPRGLEDDRAIGMLSGATVWSFTNAPQPFTQSIEGEVFINTALIKFSWWAWEQASHPANQM